MAILKKNSGVESPTLMTVLYDEKTKEPTYASINVNIEQTDEGYTWDELMIQDFAVVNVHNAPTDFKHDILISHVVKAYYNDNQMTAILNNYLLDPDNEKYKAEFDKMQGVRKLAKACAKQIIEENLF